MSAWSRGAVGPRITRKPTRNAARRPSTTHAPPKDEAREETSAPAAAAAGASSRRPGADYSARVCVSAARWRRRLLRHLLLGAAPSRPGGPQKLAVWPVLGPPHLRSACHARPNIPPARAARATHPRTHHLLSSGRSSSQASGAQRANRCLALWAERSVNTTKVAMMRRRVHGKGDGMPRWTDSLEAPSLNEDRRWTGCPMAGWTQRERRARASILAPRSKAGPKVPREQTAAALVINARVGAPHRAKRRKNGSAGLTSGPWAVGLSCGDTTLVGHLAGESGGTWSSRRHRLCWSRGGLRPALVSTMRWRISVLSLNALEDLGAVA